MGSGASAEMQETLKTATDAELAKGFAELSDDAKAKLKAALPAAGVKKNAAFVFIKPHAVTDKVKAMASDKLKGAGITIVKEGELTGNYIDEKKLIDQHYYAIAVKATIKTPKELNVPADKFKDQFGVEFAEVLEKGLVFNALDGCKEFGCDADGMAEAWNKAKDDKKLVKLGGGFYCGLLKVGDKELYIMNGFFMSMRSKFTHADAKIYYYVCEWDPAVLSWAKFRGDLLGPTDPEKAPVDSCRGHMFQNWEELGLKAVPNTGDNGMHASASPFEGLAERMNWMEVKIADDAFGKLLLDGGMSEATIQDWSVDPTVKQDADGKTGSIFDALEDMDVGDCEKKLLELSKLC